MLCRRLVTGRGDEVIEDATLEIDNGYVIGIERRQRNYRHDVALEGWVVPGFVDTHCHGGMGTEFGSPDAGGTLRAIALHRAHGSTTLFASTVSDREEATYQQLARLRRLVESGELAGIHLEGPFLAPTMRGAHALDLLCNPSPHRLTSLLDHGGPAVRMVTLAPELPGGLAAVRELVRRGVVPAIGHTAATPQRTRAALSAGAGVATHLFNGMPRIHHRGPGPVPAILSDDNVTVELIADGVHVDVEMLRFVVSCVGPDRISLITDAMSATGCETGSYSLGPLEVEVNQGVARVLLADGSLGSIAGSTLTMDSAFRRMVREVGVSVPEAARMASTTPARVHGLTNVGVLEAGRRADLCWLDDDLKLLGVLRRGRWIAAPS